MLTEELASSASQWRWFKSQQYTCEDQSKVRTEAVSAILMMPVMSGACRNLCVATVFDPQFAQNLYIRAEDSMVK